MSIKTSESGTTYRNRLLRSIVLAIRLLMRQTEPDQQSRDMAAYVVLALEKISESIDQAASAWEKRDYWVKADRFRMDWEWVQPSHDRLLKVVLNQNWPEVAKELIIIGQKLYTVKISENNRIGEPWVDCWETIQDRN